MLKILDEINHADHVKQNWLYTKQPCATNETSFNDKDEIIVNSYPGIKIMFAIGHQHFDQRIYLINEHAAHVYLKKNDSWEYLTHDDERGVNVACDAVAE